MSKTTDMKLLDHLGELRRRLTIVAAVNLGAAMVLFQYADLMMTYLFALNPGMELIYISPSELFLVYIELALIVAVILCSPVTIYQVWAFVSKGLYGYEKIYILLSLFFGLFFFAGGVYFCYRVALPTTLQFFMRLSVDGVTAMISVQNYAHFVNMLLLAFGIVFEMPVLAFLFSKLGILKPDMLLRQQGVLILIIVIVAAIITPPDVLSQVILAIPMVMLLELSIGISWVVDQGRKRKERRQEEKEEQERQARKKAYAQKHSAQETTSQS